MGGWETVKKKNEMINRPFNIGQVQPEGINFWSFLWTQVAIMYMILIYESVV